MPLPFILAGAAFAAAGFGIKKGFDAKTDLKDAERYARYAKEESEEANEKLEKQKLWTTSSLESYGYSKKEGLKNINFFDSLICYPNGERRNNTLVMGSKTSENLEEKGYRIIITKEEEMDILKKLDIIDEKLSLQEFEQEIKVRSIDMEKMDSFIKSAASGSLAGLAAGGAAYASVGYLGTTVAGTAINGLSGVAATNATLAWLGGGSLASGGLGIAGGTAILGGIVTGSLVAIGGIVMAIKASRKKDEAYEQLTRIRGEIKKLEVVISKLRAIKHYTDECHWTYDMLNSKFENNFLPKLVDIASRKNEDGENIAYKNLNEDDKKLVLACYELNYLLYQFINEPTINSDGDDALPQNQRNALTKSKNLVNAS